MSEGPLESPFERLYAIKDGRGGMRQGFGSTGALDPLVCGICNLAHYPHALVAGVELPQTVAGTSCFQLLRIHDELVEVLAVVAWSSS